MGQIFVAISESPNFISTGLGISFHTLENELFYLKMFLWKYQIKKYHPHIIWNF